MKLFVDLYRTFLSHLSDSFDELLSLDRIHWPYSCKMLWSKGRDTFKLELVFRIGQGITYGVDARVEDTDDVSCIGFFHNFSVLSQELCGLGKLDPVLSLIVEDFHSFFELA